MDIKITRREPWVKHPDRNQSLVAVSFEGCKKSLEEFFWIPTYKQMYDIRKALRDNEFECNRLDNYQKVLS